MNVKDMDAALLRIAKEIVAAGTDGVALVGIRTRGVPLADWLARKIEKVQKKPIDTGVLDINLYRDDLSEVAEQPLVKPTELPFSVTGRGIILIDDVLYTGRTIRAAMDALIDYGRPKFIRLMVMIDRGWREFPIQADYIGKKVKTDADQIIKVMLESIDGENKVIVKRKI
ncbi:MAG: bifunctional pyr operon transcriptional regulator/uracil phosphoribosyltransferase [Deltaproteobacteria bacterium RIFCSPLOWO2_02_FULL_44_10]|nr:MAG: bifunctional pyr operon transcriptional regulator/uracil phosphoribosyltransferase [Deltaproteobacteria bacterium RIFCSPHIGHO2_02_FULL_44_16]OGQ46655.1 MAG: bifunctional pyr operon transcriptional regulator/uracil phosphoribosyltransferase [Deltaproteobacteria bacterium RIFCSPLOWO2_02_FULL_44_10]